MSGMRIVCSSCEKEITEAAQGCSELNCPECGQLVNGLGQCLKSKDVDPTFAGEQYEDDY